MKQQTFSPSQLQQALGCHKNTVNKYIAKGLLEVVGTLPAGDRRISRESVETSFPWAIPILDNHHQQEKPPEGG